MGGNKNCAISLGGSSRSKTVSFRCRSGRGVPTFVSVGIHGL